MALGRSTSTDSSQLAALPAAAERRGGGAPPGAARRRASAARTKGSAMKMISKPNPSHQYMDMVSSGGSRILGAA